MTCYTFDLMPSELQISWVLSKGTYLAQRWDGERGVNLYHCADEGRGFFVEVSIDSKGQAVVLRSFVSSGPLEDYVHVVQLPEL
jgi:hypothetical protein